MKVAIFTPLSPQKTGISDYNQELIPVLSNHLDIDIFVDNFQPTDSNINSNYKIHSIDSFNQEIYQSYDEVIYHIGNNSKYHENIYLTALKYPGVVVLHDYALHHLIAQLTVGRNNWDKYVNEMEYNYGPEGVHFARESQMGKRKVMWETEHTLQYPANKRIIDSSKGIIVHSQYAYNEILRIKNDAYVQVAPLFTEDIELITESEKKSLREKYSIPQDVLIFASFGFVSRAKRIHLVLDAISELMNKYKNFLYLIVGEDEKNVYEVSKMIREQKLESHVKYIGFVTLDEFKDYIKLSDVCINLRYPTQGETSASLLRILGFGKPVIVSNVGTFIELPDECSIKISVGDENIERKEISNSIEKLLTDENLLNKMGDYGYRLVKEEHNIQVTADRYLDVLGNLFNSNVYKDKARYFYTYIDSFADKYSSLLEEDEILINRYSNIFDELFSQKIEREIV
ncbi:glycosyltransferase family 4 protein [Paenibacillus filicis]|uniref:Glycosyltransferase family 4 protein n=1 Tax=Paenibacillus gyeongsangnamensis TaxID=3388067 RepID=A0ABT4Q6Y2_9BACL|nr:glycosyltransferase family 4 protein [Paenibacillus filicis]MCZ8512556.1 glycosyltransferase family 4 protein [Paenibacillus filicis]